MGGQVITSEVMDALLCPSSRREEETQPRPRLHSLLCRRVIFSSCFVSFQLDLQFCLASVPGLSTCHPACRHLRRNILEANHYGNLQPSHEQWRSSCNQRFRTVISSSIEGATTSCIHRCTPQKPCLLCLSVPFRCIVGLKRNTMLSFSSFRWSFLGLLCAT